MQAAVADVRTNASHTSRRKKNQAKKTETKTLGKV